jgi:hypothetical protein
MTKNKFMDALESGVTVTFIKANGDTRKMNAVINPDGQPDNYSNSDAVSVIDMLTGSFRAIKASSVLSVNGEMV